MQIQEQQRQKQQRPEQQRTSAKGTNAPGTKAAENKCKRDKSSREKVQKGQKQQGQKQQRTTAKGTKAGQETVRVYFHLHGIQWDSNGKSCRYHERSQKRSTGDRMLKRKGPLLMSIFLLSYLELPISYLAT